MEEVFFGERKYQDFSSDIKLMYLDFSSDTKSRVYGMSQTLDCSENLGFFSGCFFVTFSISSIDVEREGGRERGKENLEF